MIQISYYWVYIYTQYIYLSNKISTLKTPLHLHMYCSLIHNGQGVETS